MSMLLLTGNARGKLSHRQLLSGNFRRLVDHVAGRRSESLKMNGLPATNQQNRSHCERRVRFGAREYVIGGVLATSASTVTS